MTMKTILVAREDLEGYSNLKPYWAPPSSSHIYGSCLGRKEGRNKDDNKNTVEDDVSPMLHRRGIDLMVKCT